MIMSAFNLRRVFSLVLAIISMTGCSAEELAMLASIEKLREIKSYEAETRISFDLEFSGGGEEYRDAMSRMEHIFDAARFTVNSKYEGDSKALKVKSYLNGNMTLDPVSLKGEAWLDLDLGGKQPKYELTVKIPALAKAALPEEYRKEYLFIDYMKLLDEMTREYRYGAGNFVTSSFLTQAAAMQTQFEDIIDIIKQFQNTSGILGVSVEQEAGSTTMTLTMTDYQLKRFIIALLNEAKTDEALLDKIVDINNQYAALLSPMLSLSYIDKEELKKNFAEQIDSDLAEIEEYFESNALLGEKGLVYQFVLDKNGDISEQNITLCINLNAISAPYLFMYNNGGNPSRRGELTVYMQSVYTKVGEKIDFSFPKLDDTNSVSLVEAMRVQGEKNREEMKYYFPYYGFSEESNLFPGEAPVDFPLEGSAGGKDVDDIITIAQSGGELYMPIRQAAELFGGEVSWNEEKRIAVWETQDGTAWIAADAEAYTELQESGEYERAVYDGERYVYFNKCNYKYEGAVYMSLREVEHFAGVDFGFDDETQRVLIK